MAETIFSKILRGEVPCYKVYEDEHVLALLDINPLSYGHMLVVPKEPAETLDRLSDDAAAALGRVLPRLCRALKGATGCTAYNLLQNNGASAHQAVFHVHFHIIPKPSDAQGLGIRWPAGVLSPEAGKTLAQKLSQAVSSESQT